MDADLIVAVYAPTQGLETLFDDPIEIAEIQRITVCATPAYVVEASWVVTFVPHSSELFRFAANCRTLFLRPMLATGVKLERRRQERMQAVLPVRVRGTDAAGDTFEALAHTLDLTPTGARLGSIRRALKVCDTLTIFYRQRRVEFTVVWIKLLDGRQEYQVGLHAFAQEKDPWGMNFFASNAQIARQAQVSGAA